MKKQESKSYTDSQKKAIYNHAQKIERIYLTVPKGKKAVYEEAAAQKGMSLNAFICDAIEKEINGK